MTQPPLSPDFAPHCCICHKSAVPPRGGRCLLHDYRSNPATGEVTPTVGCGFALCGRAHCTREHYATYALSDARLAQWERLTNRRSQHRAAWHGGAAGTPKQGTLG